MSARFVILTAGLLAFVAPSAQALELKNIRPSYGHLGPTRTDMKFLPGDFLLVNFDIDGLKLDEKGTAKFVVLLEVFDAKAKSIYNKQTPNVTIPQLGGNRQPSDFHVVMGIEYPPGQYKARLTVQDALANETKSFTINYELLPRGFGIVGAMAPTVGFLGEPYFLRFNVIDFALDAANKPKGKLEIKILDESGKPVSPPAINEYPKDLPDGVDLKKENYLPIDYPIFPNRAGRFVLEITATDNQAAPKTATLRIPLTIIDVGAMSAAPK